jgi:hypothetical protein
MTRCGSSAGSELLGGVEKFYRAKARGKNASSRRRGSAILGILSDEPSPKWRFSVFISLLFDSEL